MNAPSMQVATLDEMSKMAAAVVKSKLFGFETQEQAFAIMMIAQAEGRPAALAARDYHVIKGKPALKADAMLARFQQAGGVVEWTTYDDTKVAGKFSHPQSCPKPVEIIWTIEQARKAGLTGKDVWRSYPRAMLRSRVISEGVRTTYPGIAVGVYTVEEVQDMTPERDITPTAGAGDTLSQEARQRVEELADKVREWMACGSLTDAYGEIDNAGLDGDEQIFLWTLFDSRVRRQLKEEGERQRLRAKAKTIDAPINAAQRKRLEARIGELGLDRESVKAWCAEKFGKDHFAELSRDEYNELDGMLESMAPAQDKRSGVSPVAATPAAEATPTDAPQDSIANLQGMRATPSDEGVGQGVNAEASTPTDVELVADIEAWVKKRSFDMAYDLCRGIKDEAFRDATKARIDKAKSYVDAKQSAASA